MSSKKFTIDNFFPERLKLFIDELKIKQSTFAETIGITHGYLSMILKGKRGPSAEMIANLYVNYRDKFLWLLTGIDEEQEHIEEQAASYAGLEDRGEQNELRHLLTMVLEILTSQTIFKDLLTVNIRGMHQGLKEQRQCSDIHEKLTALEKKTARLSRLNPGKAAGNAHAPVHHAVAVIKRKET